MLPYASCWESLIWEAAEQWDCLFIVTQMKIWLEVSFNKRSIFWLFYYFHLVHFSLHIYSRISRMQMAERPDNRNLLIITVDSWRWQRASVLAESVRLHKKARGRKSLQKLKSMPKLIISGQINLSATTKHENWNINLCSSLFFVFF